MTDRGNVASRYRDSGESDAVSGGSPRTVRDRLQQARVIDEPDELLLDRAARGDNGAFAVLYERHRRQLLATALRTIRTHADAEDCLQDAMLRAYQLSPTFRGDCKVASWMHRIVVNACLDRARRNQIRLALPIPDDLSNFASDEGRGAEDLDRRLSVDAALRLLPEDQRAAVIAVDMHGLSVSQAAEVLGVAVGTVKSRRARARARLERLLL
ncbi:RNA polymerase, sigma-24 subunit, ECF subfamily OS=Tsukamurella paurometabola (strain ATCC 8368 /DSM / CCUG 35730 / CIP 100753 / JCM 10117 / KCTC 9821/ NBRC 16120 / NCIMB 702349 / NCTC 13040) OX=521096 GN=Tpau_4230 PE=3 SV=1 [Tsukamurella paurometabola]|uniref:RNA polymerase, sigma-24 subunit, ECF subfamily n=1 Tax=Tsukamurella paurometabola (strain ATCC 8368 / DSM 20162 / CCUG 35730 / CIP 100753 / JCM 10117 / KCTC 9821 / NBRC 16120 / NCIMB 702349 / NCTC 13040) TaxID=521096 RepID=D5UP89_TSUPD|nr:RNA polymerase sigma factor SigM [Tsukamurella paurometabola]ADG80798.1 RNA polymerase, sigma-24 subunit, ECF subfamily [Tsukamurella paurometabola DSM 20162]SUP41028.1 Sigma-24 [Tsukamurella paurometabola]